MMYLTYEQFLDLGFGEVEEFALVLDRAVLLIDRFIDDFYRFHDWETDNEYRKSLVKKATAFQVDYLNKSGIQSAEDKQALSSVTLGRTRIDFNGANRNHIASRYNLSADSLTYLNMAGFGYSGVSYDR